MKVSEKRLRRAEQRVEILEGMIEDSTRDLYLANERLREQNDFLSNILESISHPFYVIDARDYKIKMANSAAKAENFAKDLTCHELIHKRENPCDDPETPCGIKEVIRTVKPVTVEHTHYTLGGDARYFEVHAYPVLGASGEVTQVIEYALDITERRQAERAHRESEARFRALVESTNDWIWEVDKDGVYTYSSPKVKDILGYEPEEVTGMTPFDLMPPEEAARVREEFEKISEEQRPFAGLENKNLTRDGRLVVLETNGVPVFDGDGGFRGYRGIDRDITTRKAIEERNKYRLKELSALRSIDRAIQGSLDLRVVLDVVLSRTIDLLKVDAADILLFRPHIQVLEYAAGKGFSTDALRHTRLKIGESLAGRAAVERRTVSVTDLRKDPGELKKSMDLEKEGFVTYFGAPLTAKGEVKGVLEVFTRSEVKPDEEWLDFLDTLAGQSAIAIDNAELVSGLERSNTELITAYDETIEGWSRALDLRDKETEGHSRRVTGMTMLISEAMGIDDGELANMRRGALLHDIGKMGIPDSILLKPGPLDDKEMETMRRHPVYAYELLSPIRFLRPAIEIPYCHHERWDGTGYPRGLKGEEIPISARIFAVVDIYDALSSERPYRRPWPEEKVIEHLRTLSGKHLDPGVMKVFFRLSGDGSFKRN